MTLGNSALQGDNKRSTAVSRMIVRIKAWRRILDAAHETASDLHCLPNTPSSGKCCQRKAWVSATGYPWLRELAVVADGSVDYEGIRLHGFKRQRQPSVW